MKNIFSKRLKSARLIKGYSMQELAEMLNVSKQMISKYEKGLSVPDSSGLIRMSKALGQNADYFFKPSAVELKEVKFRKKSCFSAKKLKALEEEVLQSVENYLDVESILAIKSEFRNPLSGLNADTYEDIKKAAETLRKAWDLGHDPIHNVIELMENNLIKVIEISASDNKFDGLSSFIDNKYPVIVINDGMNTERKRFTLLHELGHLLLEFKDDITEKDQEHFCNAFAGNMLLPSKVLSEDFGVKRERISLQEMKAVQENFGISIQAIIYRLVDEKIISKSSQEDFYKKYNSISGIKEEVDMQRYCVPERSERFYRLVYRALTQELISIGKAASLLGKQLSEVRKNFSVVID
ncbi:MAG: ImmA/IrrE family metallo-endopeptidase [Candidatus Delongbacteria bacterium]|nr:ImmA/IrrE family metallo-endopeptidase [Candidatus Delongbacteria bacterium]